jgi:hypothetical protein
MRTRWFALLALAVVPLLLTPGCGGRGRPVAASGTVQWDDGTPIAGATINFMSKEEGVKDAHGFSGPDGQFDLTTFSSGDGALPGVYAVVVTKQSAEIEPVTPGSEDKGKAVVGKMKEHQEKFQGKPKSMIPATYTNQKTTPLQATVTAGEDNKFVFKLKKV